MKKGAREWIQEERQREEERLHEKDESDFDPTLNTTFKDISL